MKNKIEALQNKLKHGVSPALATPVTADGYTVNVDQIPALIEFLESKDSKGLFVGGSTGEGILLTTEERKRLHKTAVEAASVPVMLHIGANRTDTAVALANHAAQIGADAIAAVTPYYYGFHDEGLINYYQAISQAAPELPLLLYDIPHMAVNGISPAFIKEVQEKVPTIAGIKTSRGNMIEINALLKAAAPPFITFAGKEPLALGALSYGFDGLVSGLSTAIPEPFVALTAAYGAGDLQAAQAHQQTVNRLLTCIPAGYRIGTIKQILAERGFAVGTAVPPRPMPHEPIWPSMQAILES